MAKTSKMLVAARIFGDENALPFDVELEERPKIGQIVLAADSSGRVRRLSIAWIHIKAVQNWHASRAGYGVEIRCHDLDREEDG